ncbi:MAG: hypothetical protein KGJ57_18150 [Sphingomonadales bacterium]|nr:hypothetical protein [Sphingomonadales bacterium]MDE2171321.1 hypothetical protein [Sphingomonadales bacterium]
MTQHAGLQVFGADGVLRLDTEDATALILGQFTTGSGHGDSGSINDANLSLGTPFWYVISLAWPSGGFAYVGYGPAVSISGNTVSWSWPHGDNGAVATIVYGVH